MGWLASGLLVVGSLAGLGLLYQVGAGWWDRRAMTSRGRFVDVKGKRFFVSEHGAGSPTVVFESGLVASTLNWLGVQRAIGAETRTFSYDRLGLGWSDACSGERIPSVMARELHDLLRAAAVPGPYLLVAHSYGALIARAFVAEHGREVAGIVMVDPMRTEGWLPGNEGGRHILRGGRRLMWRAKVPTWLGLTRVGVQSLVKPNAFTKWLLKHLLGAAGGRAAGRMTRELCKMPAEVQSEVVAQWSLTGFYAGSAAHIHGVPASVREVQRLQPIMGVPTIVLRPERGPLTSEEFAHCVGDSVRHIVVEGSGHWVHLDCASVVIDAVREMVEVGRESMVAGV